MLRRLSRLSIENLWREFVWECCVLCEPLLFHLVASHSKNCRCLFCLRYLDKSVKYAQVPKHEITVLVHRNPAAAAQWLDLIALHTTIHAEQLLMCLNVCLAYGGAVLSYVRSFICQSVPPTLYRG